MTRPMQNNKSSAEYNKFIHDTYYLTKGNQLVQRCANAVPASLILEQHRDHIGPLLTEVSEGISQLIRPCFDTNDNIS